MPLIIFMPLHIAQGTRAGHEPRFANFLIDIDCLMLLPLLDIKPPSRISSAASSLRRAQCRRPRVSIAARRRELSSNSAAMSPDALPMSGRLPPASPIFPPPTSHRPSSGAADRASSRSPHCAATWRPRARQIEVRRQASTRAGFSYRPAKAPP